MKRLYRVHVPFSCSYGLTGLDFDGVDIYVRSENKELAVKAAKKRFYRSYYDKNTTLLGWKLEAYRVRQAWVDQLHRRGEIR